MARIMAFETLNVYLFCKAGMMGFTALELVADYFLVMSIIRILGQVTSGYRDLSRRQCAHNNRTSMYVFFSAPTTGYFSGARSTTTFTIQDLYVFLLPGPKLRVDKDLVQGSFSEISAVKSLHLLLQTNKRYLRNT